MDTRGHQRVERVETEGREMRKRRRPRPFFVQRRIQPDTQRARETMTSGSAASTFHSATKSDVTALHLHSDCRKERERERENSGKKEKKKSLFVAASLSAFPLSSSLSLLLFLSLSSSAPSPLLRSLSPSL